ncbi:MAG: DMT family transporter [Myxococcales bacterium]
MTKKVRQRADMARARLIVICALTLCAFASNSLLTRRALAGGLAGAASFASLRLLSGAAMLWILSRNRRRAGAEAGWWSAIWLFLYAAPFSWAYLRLSAGVGAFLLFGTVQATMIGAAVLHGERPPLRTWLGLALALGGLAALTLPGAKAPPFAAAAAMIAAGLSWGAYSLRGRRARDGISATADAFIRSAPFAAVLWVTTLLFAPNAAMLSGGGAVLAVASGVLASGLGYSLWNSALPHIRLSTAAIMQISVPPLAAVGGIALLGERPTARLVLGGGAIVAGVALAILPRKAT